jgi:Amt family ammonium transporter
LLLEVKGLTDSSLSSLLVTISLFLVPLAAAGLALMNSGLTRTRSVAHSLFLSLCAFSLGAVVYFAFGFAIQGAPTLPSSSLTLGGRQWGWIGGGAFFGHGLPPDAVLTWQFAYFGMLAAGLASLIPIGTGAERWRTAASLISTTLLAGLIFPLFGHWAGNSGWLANGGILGREMGLRDAAGSGFIHVTGGLSALSVGWLVGPRRGKYAASGMPTATPGHNAAFILFGCSLALPGWIGLNTAGAILFGGAEFSHAPSIAVITLLSAAGGALSAAAVTRARFGKPDASLCANGWTCGLVSSSAACAWTTPAEALLVALVAGALVIYAIELLELRMRIDDPAGAISVHGVGGLWGLLATGILNGGTQFVPQLLGIATLLGFVFPLLYGLNCLANRFVPYRARPENERQGMDLTELGAGAYPEFMLHRDDLGFR